MTQVRWWLAASLVALALTWTARAQECPYADAPKSCGHGGCSKSGTSTQAQTDEPQSPEKVPMPRPCDDPAESDGSYGSDCTGSCPPKASACPATARHNEGSSCGEKHGCGSGGCCSTAHGCCASGSCTCTCTPIKKHPQACHREEFAPSAALVLPTWFGPLPIPMPPPMASFFFGAGVDYHVHAPVPCCPAVRACPPGPPSNYSVIEMEGPCPHACPVPPPAPMMHPIVCPAGAPMMQCAIIQRATVAARPWQMHVSADHEKAEMEIHDGATRISCDNMDVKLGDKALKVSISEKQLSIVGEDVKATADKVSKGCEEGCLILDGHVHIEYQKDDQKIEASVEHVKISLKDGHMEIKTSASSAK
jgi:hypothetical protein